MVLRGDVDDEDYEPNEEEDEEEDNLKAISISREEIENLQAEVEEVRHQNELNNVFSQAVELEQEHSHNPSFKPTTRIFRTELFSIAHVQKIVTLLRRQVQICFQALVGAQTALVNLRPLVKQASKKDKPKMKRRVIALEKAVHQALTSLVEIKTHAERSFGSTTTNHLGLTSPSNLTNPSTPSLMSTPINTSTPSNTHTPLNITTPNNINTPNNNNTPSNRTPRSNSNTPNTLTTPTNPNKGISIYAQVMPASISKLLKIFHQIVPKLQPCEGVVHPALFKYVMEPMIKEFEPEYMFEHGEEAASQAWTPIEDELFALGLKKYHKRELEQLRLALLPHRVEKEVKAHLKKVVTKKQKGFVDYIKHPLGDFSKAELARLAYGFFTLDQFSLVSAQFLPTNPPSCSTRSGSRSWVWAFLEGVQRAGC